VPENPDGTCAYWFYTLHAGNRDELMAKLKAAGIGASKVHARNDLHTMFRAFRTELEGARRFHDTHLCIPVGWWVSDADRAYVADKVIEYARA
jgi:dTDP-4-amino-4,6-dideoxygalactose transaminase